MLERKSFLVKNQRLFQHVPLSILTFPMPYQRFIEIKSTNINLNIPIHSIQNPGKYLR